MCFSILLLQILVLWSVEAQDGICFPHTLTGITGYISTQKHNSGEGGWGGVCVGLKWVLGMCSLDGRGMEEHCEVWRKLLGIRSLFDINSIFMFGGSDDRLTCETLSNNF